MADSLTIESHPRTGPGDPPGHSPRTLVGMVLGLLAVLTVMLLAFAAPAR